MKRNIIIGLAICIIGCAFAACNDEEPVVDYRYSWVGVYKYEKHVIDEILGTGTLSVRMVSDSNIVIKGKICFVEPNGTFYEYYQDGITGQEGITGHFAKNTLIFKEVRFSMHGMSCTNYICTKTN